MSKFTSALSLLLLALMTTVACADVASLVSALSEGDVNSRINAARALGELGAKAEAAVPALARAIKSSDESVQIAAMLALSNIGPAATGAVTALTDTLSDASGVVRAHAAHALGRIGDASESTVTALIESAVDADPMVRREVRDALREIKAPSDVTLPIWVKTLQDSDPTVVMRAIHTLAELGKEAVPGLRPALRDHDACYWACLAVGAIGPDAKELVPELSDLLKHDEPECRMQALVSLGEIGPGAKSAVPAIVELMTKEDFDSVKYAGAFALGQLDDSPAAKNALMTLLQSDDGGLRTISAWSLLKIDPQDPDGQLLKVIVDSLGSKDANVRQIAIRALRDLPTSDKERSQEVIEAFVDTMNSATPEVVGQVIDALASKGADAVPGIVRGLNNKNLRPYAVQVAMRLGPAGQPAVPALVEALKETTDDDELRREIHFAIGAIGPSAALAVPELVKSLDSEAPEVVYSACYALGKIGTAARDATQALRKNLQSEDKFLRTASTWSLLQIHPDNARLKEFAVRIMTEALSIDRDDVRAEAAETLGNIGAPARTALPALRQALEDESPLVRAAAKTAIERIEAN